MHRTRTLVVLISTLAMMATVANVQIAPAHRLLGASPSQRLAAQGAPAHSASSLGSNPFLPIDYPGAIAAQIPTSPLWTSCWFDNQVGVATGLLFWRLPCRRGQRFFR